PASIKCHDCLSKLVLLKKHPTCPGCCRRQIDHSLCQDCIRWKRRYLTDSFNHLALYAYNEPMKEWLEQYKFHGDIRQAHAFSEEIKQSLKPFIKEGYLFAPIPVDSDRLESRGFNQVEELLECAELPYSCFLGRKAGGKKQSDKNRKERMETKQPFYIKKEWQENVQGKKIFLIDDVYTTGRTLFHAADVLKEAGAS